MFVHQLKRNKPSSIHPVASRTCTVYASALKAVNWGRSAPVGRLRACGQRKTAQRGRDSADSVWLLTLYRLEGTGHMQVMLCRVDASVVGALRTMAYLVVYLRPE